MVAPCPSCYQREKNAAVEIHESDAFRAEVNEMLDAPYTGNVPSTTSSKCLIEKVGEETIAKLVKTDLLAAQGRAVLRLPAGPSGAS